MKNNTRLISAILAAMLCATAFSACANGAKPPVTDVTTDASATAEPIHALDIWDGTVAASFGGGNGSKEAPYEIATAAQLAYLADVINHDKVYTGKYFVLTADLDLANIPWTPIGNGMYHFDGIFDGKGHTITNLTIINGFNYAGPSEGTWDDESYTSGLFGSCSNAVLKNLNITHAYLSTENAKNRHQVNAGILVGDMRADKSLELSNVKIEDSSIVCVYDPEREVPRGQNIGGVAGYVRTEGKATYTIFNLQSTIAVSIENIQPRDNDIGGIAGVLFLSDYGKVNNCASYLSVKLNQEDCYLDDNYFGAFGFLATVSGKVSVTNVFSKVSVNKKFDYYFKYPAYTANIIAGHISRLTNDSGFCFENVFGYVEQKDEITGEIAISLQLNDISKSAIYTEVNCKGCTELPAEHNFDTEVWNLDSPEAPVLKFQN